MDSVYIIGAGGEGQVFAEVIISVGLGLKGFFDDNDELLNRQVFGVPVLGKIKDVVKYKGLFIISIGNNRVRKRIVDEINVPKGHYLTVFHPYSYRGIGTKFDCGSICTINSSVGTYVEVGSHVIVSMGSCVSHHNLLEDYVFFGPNACSGGGVHIKEGAFIGMGASILPNITIGKWAIVGAGSVVIKDVPDYVTVVGNPAKIIKIKGGSLSENTSF